MAKLYCKKHSKRVIVFQTTDGRIYTKHSSEGTDCDEGLVYVKVNETAGKVKVRAVIPRIPQNVNFVMDGE